MALLDGLFELTQLVIKIADNWLVGHKEADRNSDKSRKASLKWPCLHFVRKIWTDLSSTEVPDLRSCIEQTIEYSTATLSSIRSIA